MASTPFLGHTDPAAIVAWRGARPLHVADFLQDVQAVAEALPARSYLVNFCSDRYRFAVGLAAALLREQVTLLPPAQTPEPLRTLQQGYEGVYALYDAAHPPPVLETVVFPSSGPTGRIALQRLAFPDAQLAAIAFTSGSTGEPAPQPKSWGRLALGSIAEAQSLGLIGAASTVIVGTVPPQHMYGLESSVLLALRTGLALHAVRPFYPADIRAVLEEIPGERVLVTTPVHLRALLSEESSLPPLRLIVCATAPLSPAMAGEAETRYGAPLYEIYGFTEAGMVASRRTTQGPRWHVLPGVRVWRDAAGAKVGGGHVEGEAAFTDVVELEDAHSFLLHGRGADLVNIAGKRTSLAYLDQQLGAIEGVEDAVFFMPDEDQAGVTRLTAFVVAPGLSREALVSALRGRIDAAFLPRPLYQVDSLPRNAVGKLPREALLQLAAVCAALAKNW
jgi:acyl-coenzyme A synthetase/AMP-(fatty) acid ligase